MKKLFCLIASALIAITSVFAFGIEGQFSGGEQASERAGLTFCDSGNLAMAAGLKVIQSRDSFWGLYYSIDYVFPLFGKTTSFKAGPVIGSELAVGFSEYSSYETYDSYTTVTSYSDFNVSFVPYLGLDMEFSNFKLMLTGNYDLRFGYSGLSVGLIARYRFSGARGVRRERIGDKVGPDYYFRGNLNAY